MTTFNQHARMGRVRMFDLGVGIRQNLFHAAGLRQSRGFLCATLTEACQKENLILQIWQVWLQAVCSD